MAQKTTIAALTPDEKNANRGNQRGTGMIEESLRKYGAGRSILVDKNGRVIAGNKTLEGATSIGLEDVIVVETDGKKLVAVKRTDLDLDSPEARELAIADNRTGQVNLEWDPAVLSELAQEGVDIHQFWSENEFNLLLGQIGEPDDPREHWSDMPSGMPDEPMAHRMINVYFKTPEAVHAFFALVEQTYTDNTKTIWYPAKTE